MSGNAPVSVNIPRSKDFKRYPASIKGATRASVPMCGIGLEPDCEQLLFRYFCHSEHPRGAGGWGLRCKNIDPFDSVFTSQWLASSALWVPAMTKVPKQKLLVVRFLGYCTHWYTRTTGTFHGNRVSW